MKNKANIPKYFGILILFTCILETILRENGTSEYFRPFYYIKQSGDFARDCWYYLGTFIGWILYGIYNFLYFVAEKMFGAIQTTIIEFCESIKGFVDIRALFDGIKDISYEFWINYQTQIIIGLIITVIVISIGLMIYGTIKVSRSLQSKKEN
jgi:hypothetical protein